MPFAPGSQMDAMAHLLVALRQPVNSQGMSPADRLALIRWLAKGGD